MGYPCPNCVDTMLPGIRYSFPREPVLVGTGKVWSAYQGSSNFGTPPPQLHTCPRCHGAGVVNERRSGKVRRSGAERRTADKST